MSESIQSSSYIELLPHLLRILVSHQDAIKKMAILSESKYFIPTLKDIAELKLNFPKIESSNTENSENIEKFKAFASQVMKLFVQSQQSKLMDPEFNAFFMELLSTFASLGILELAPAENKVDSGIVMVGICCDSCHIAPILGFAYHCLVCPDYDACTDCQNKEVGNHKSTHAMEKRNFPKAELVHVENKSLNDVKSEIMENNKKRKVSE